MKIKKAFLKLLFQLLLFTFPGHAQTVYDRIFSSFGNNTAPALFAPELHLKDNTYKGCFSADYTTFYFFRKQSMTGENYRIFQSDFSNGKWSDPTMVGFADTSSDVYPMVSTIEPHKLFFTSYRRTPGDTSSHPNANFWTVTKAGNHWSRPEAFRVANLIRNYNSQPCMTRNGNIYFTSHTPDWRNTLTYRMVYKNGNYQSPVLYTMVDSLRKSDTSNTIYEVCMSPEENYMILVISTHHASPKLFVSYNRQDKWSAPVYLGDIIKGDMTGNFPYITPDGKFLLFTRAFSGFFIIPVKTFITPV